jgi:DNA-binding NarL/FixJ family response regulator
MNALAHHRYPWTPAEEAVLVERYCEGVRHKQIARELSRTPRSIDEQVARLKDRGVLARVRKEERELLARVEAEARQPERYRHETRG